MNSLVFTAARGEGRPLPLGLAGMPTTLEGRPVHYRRKELAPVCEFVHRGTRRAESLTRARFQKWVAAFKKRFAKGIKPFIPDKHTLQPSAKDNFGYVVGLSVQGDRLYADLQLIGDDALALASRNDVSLCVVSDAIDHDGEKYDEVLHHVALTPDPALGNLGGYVKLAASAGGSPVDVPVYQPQPAAAPKQRSKSMLTAEQMQKLRQKLSLSADVPDEQVMDVAAEHVVAAIDVQAKARADAEKVTSLSAELSNLKRELAAANEKVLSLSADAPKELDPRTLGMIRKSCKTARDQAVASGVISTAGMDKIDKLLGVSEPNGIALSLSADNPDEVVYTSLCEIIAAHPGVRTNNAISRAKLALSSGNADADGEPTAERKAALMKETPLGQAALAGAK